MTQVFIGAFYGIPIFPPEQMPSIEQLHSLEERFLSQYYLHRDTLTSSLLSYATLQGGATNSRQYEERVNMEYQQCFNMQVSLARLRNFISRSKSEGGRVRGEVFQLPEESRVSYAHCSISKLSKMVGCLVDTLLALNVDANKSVETLGPPAPGTKSRSPDDPAIAEDEGLVLDTDTLNEVHLLTEEECRILFYTLCIHGIPKMHARAIALLIKYGGSQLWWGGFIVKVAAELFSSQQTSIFNKERYI